MKAVIISEYGGPEVLQLIEVLEPHAGPGEVRVRVHAAAVNAADMLFRLGDLDDALSPHAPRPYRAGMDLAGVLDEVGDDTDTDLRIGDRVMAIVFPNDHTGGAYAEFVVLQPQQVSPAPAGSDHVQASTLPMSGLTARHGIDMLGLPPNAWIAVTGAAGAVGGYAVELAKADGLNVIVDAAPSDEELMRSLGADVVVRRGDGLAERILQVRADGVDAIVDAALLGAEVEPAIRPGGQLLILRRPGERGMRPLSGRADIKVRDVWVPDHRIAREKLDHLRGLVEQDKLTMRVGGVYPAAQAPEAHRRFETGGVRGRLVLTFAAGE